MAKWRPVVGYEGIYEVSDDGQVQSVNRLDAGARRCRACETARSKQRQVAQ